MSLNTNQNEIFYSGEGDSWFRRNVSELQTIQQSMRAEDVRYICDFFKPYERQIHKVLEIGCSNGIKLESICNQLNASGEGIDPSSLAIEAGNAREKISDIALGVGVAEALPYQNSQFDLVYFSFCLYLVDRKTIIQALAEADRVLKPGGFLVITDFDPGVMHKRPYSHHQGVFSYKQDYSVFYMQSGLYYLAGKHCFSHSRSSFDECVDERISTTILYKEVNPYPARA